MPWLLFTADWSWVPPEAPMSSIAFRAGSTHLVTTPCAQAAIARGVATKTSKPSSASKEKSNG